MRTFFILVGSLLLAIAAAFEARSGVPIPPGFARGSSFGAGGFAIAGGMCFMAAAVVQHGRLTQGARSAPRAAMESEELEFSRERLLNDR